MTTTPRGVSAVSWAPGRIDLFWVGEDGGLVHRVREGDAWLPLAVGDLPFETVARADAWLLVPGGSEGYAAGAPANAYVLRE